jgi:hypothetical protein
MLMKAEVSFYLIMLRQLPHSCLGFGVEAVVKVSPEISISASMTNFTGPDVLVKHAPPRSSLLHPSFCI